MQTQNGIELDLSKSNYKYEFRNYIFYFSSKLYMEKFSKNVSDYILIESLKLKNKYMVHIDFSLFLSVAFYKKVEKRGFRIVHKNMGFIISENTVFNTEYIS